MIYFEEVPKLSKVLNKTKMARSCFLLLVLLPVLSVALSGILKVMTSTEDAVDALDYLIGIQKWNYSVTTNTTLNTNASSMYLKADEHILEWLKMELKRRKVEFEDVGRMESSLDGKDFNVRLEDAYLEKLANIKFKGIFLLYFVVGVFFQIILKKLFFLFPDDKFCMNRSGLTFKVLPKRLKGIQDFIYCLAETYPSLVKVKRLGFSHNNRTLQVVHLSKDHANAGANKDSVFILAGVHGNEWNVIASVLYMLKEFVEEDLEIYNDILEKHDIFIYPLANPDGFVFSTVKERSWVKNRRVNHAQDYVDYLDYDAQEFNDYYELIGVEPIRDDNVKDGIPDGQDYDIKVQTQKIATAVLLGGYKDPLCNGVNLGFNFDYKWGGDDMPMDSCSNEFGGMFRHSEPEVLAISQFVADRRNNIKMVMDFHEVNRQHLNGK